MNLFCFLRAYSLRTLAAVVLLLFGPAFVVQAQGKKEHPEFVTSETCAGCHAPETEAWKLSDHSWAWLEPTEETVLGDFSGVTFEHQGIETKFYRENGRYFIETDAVGGARENYAVEYVIGVRPLQQYLIKLDKGRLQVLDVAWDTDAKRWYMVFPDHEDNVPGNAIHWTGVYKNWNGRCAECHATDFKKNYNPETRSFQSEWAEIGVTCESCHGPGQAHVDWASDPDIAALKAYLGVDDKGLVKPATRGKQSQEIQMCGGCHSRRTTLTGDSPMPGSHFANNFDLATLRPGLYHPDGQILDEVYVLGSFRQSKMFEAGVTCSDCHNPHSGKVLTQDNGLCTQCHNSDGNERFPSLQKKDYDTISHFNHAVGSEGAQCVACHMPETTYMQVDPRRDHKFGVPHPELSETTGAPNACSSCHIDKDAGWAAGQIDAWFPASQRVAPEFARIFARAQNAPGSEGLIGELFAVAGSDLPSIIRATALDRLQTYAGGFDWQVAAPFLRDPDPLVRYSAVRLYQRAPDQVRMTLVFPALKDAARSVRIAAARTLVTIPASAMTERQRQVMRVAMQEYHQSLVANSDHPSTQMAMAGLALSFRNLAAAKAAINEALAIDPQLADGWIMRSNVENAERRPDLVRITMKEALKNLPNSPTIHQFFGNYLAGQRQHDAAVALLERAVVLSDRDSRVRTDLATVLIYAGQLDQALTGLEDLLLDNPSNTDVLFLKADVLRMMGRVADSQKAVQQLLELDPDFALPDNLNVD